MSDFSQTINRRPRVTKPLLLLITVAALLLSPRPLLAQEGDDTAQIADSLLQIVNQARQQAGIAPMQAHPLLIQAAQFHADDMSSHHLFSHTGSNGSSVEVRTSRRGYQSSKGVSENWVTTASADSALAWWMNSYVHRGNILNPKWTETGIGIGRDPSNGLHIFVLVFGGGNNGGGVAPPQPITAAVAPVVSPPAPAPLPAGKPYVVQPGDTLLAIAMRYGLTWQDVAAANGLSEQSLLQIGETIRLPIEDAPTVSNPAAIGGPTDAVQGYTVQPGDTLLVIAGRYGLAWQELAAANGLAENELLSIGQTLRIPAITETIQQQSSVQPQFYTVQAGDTVISIALRYNLDWKELLRSNGLGEQTVLSLGQQIRLE